MASWDTMEGMGRRAWSCFFGQLYRKLQRQVPPLSITSLYPAVLPASQAAEFGNDTVHHRTVCPDIVKRQLRPPGLHRLLLGLPQRLVPELFQGSLRQRALSQYPRGYLPGGGLCRLPATRIPATTTWPQLFPSGHRADAADMILSSMSVAATIISVNKFVFGMDWTHLATSRDCRRHTSRGQGRSASIPRVGARLRLHRHSRHPRVRHHRQHHPLCRGRGLLRLTTSRTPTRLSLRSRRASPGHPPI